MLKIVRGIVVPAAWGENGEILSIAIDTYKEERYLVVENTMGLRLKKLLRRRVYVEGNIHDLDHQPMVIEVEFYKPDEPLWVS